jgi:hypothetical protein
MKRTIIAAALALTMTSGAAYACDDLTYIKVSNLADQLGSILGSKKACGIEYE